MSIPAESSGIPTPAGKELAAVTVEGMVEAMAAQQVLAELHHLDFPNPLPPPPHQHYNHHHHHPGPRQRPPIFEMVYGLNVAPPLVALEEAPVRWQSVATGLGRQTERQQQPLHRC